MYDYNFCIEFTYKYSRKITSGRLILQLFVLKFFIYYDKVDVIF